MDPFCSSSCSSTSTTSLTYLARQIKQGYSILRIFKPLKTISGFQSITTQFCFYLYLNFTEEILFRSCIFRVLTKLQHKFMINFFALFFAKKMHCVLTGDVSTNSAYFPFKRPCMIIGQLDVKNWFKVQDRSSVIFYLILLIKLDFKKNSTYY